MKKVEERIEVTLEYIKGVEDPEKGYFEGGVSQPEFLNELMVWTEELSIFDEAIDDFRTIPGRKVNLSGSPRALYELGRYLIALSKLETSNRDYHDHFDDVGVPKGMDQCEMVIHAPSRITQSASAG